MGISMKTGTCFFLFSDILPLENWNGGFLIMELMMSVYRSAEVAKTIKYDPVSLKNFKPKVAKRSYQFSKIEN
jgi:hypothetical protein